MRTWIVIAALLGAALHLGSCAEGLQPTKGGSGGDSTSSSSSSGGMSTACPAYAKSVCGKLQTCATTLFNTSYESAAACETRQTAVCEKRAAAAGTSFKDSKIQACATEIDGVACTDFATATLSACAPTSGTLANGAACGDHNQCQSSYCKSSNGQCGTCASRLTLGESCAGAADGCEKGLVCDGTCQTPVTLGGLCTSSAQCAPGLRCTAMNACEKPPSKLGDTCDAINVGCDFTAGLWCDAGSSKCVAVNVAQAGESCAIAAGSFTACAAGGLCSNQICVAPVADGTACDGTGNPPCQTDAACIDGKCQIFDPSSCAGGSQDLCMESCVDSQGSVTGMSFSGTVSWTQSSCACGSLKSGLPAGSSCTTASDCAEVCCFCCSAARSFQARACVDGVCQGIAGTCPLAKSESMSGTKLQCD